MKNFIVLLMISFSTNMHTQAQADLNGAWKSNQGNQQHQLFLQNGFFFYTVHQGNQFVKTKGGHFSVKDHALHTAVLFNSADSGEVNQNIIVPFSISSGILSLNLGEGSTKFERVDEGKAPLAGVWHITGRMDNEGKVVQIHQTGTRKTYKLLTGTKFQWAAIDPGTKQFMGTGGGTYTFKDGKYTENIEFFSRDNSRVGASLTFDGKLENGQWHHSGLSSKGARIYEIWSKVPAMKP